MAKIEGVTATPTLDSEATSKKYVDDSRFHIYEIETTIDDTPLPINILTLANNTSYTFNLKITGRLNDTAVNKSVGGFLRFISFRNNAGVATIVGTPAKEIDDHGTSGYDFDVTVSGNNVRVSVTGAAAEVVNWTIGGNIVRAPGNADLAIGGTITEIIDGGNDYRVHTFTDVGTDSFVVLAASLDVEYLVVAGAGGGGSGGGGGGGAGGLLTNTFTRNSGVYTVTVGAGGAGGSPSGSPDAGDNGQNSVFDTITSTAGGGGGFNGAATQNGSSGGSGGGGGNTGGAGTGGQGNTGGNGDINTTPFPAGGGGGAGAVGGNFSGSLAGVGGAGSSSSINGTATTYAGGGGGGVYETGIAGGAGGSGGGGNGSHTGSGSAGSANRGSGGGGATRFSGVGGNGGSGIVIIRYQI